MRKKISRNTAILADAAYETAAEGLRDFNEALKVDINFYDIMKLDTRDRLQEEIPQHEKGELHQQLQDIHQVVLDKKSGTKTTRGRCENKEG
jgi:hypothetical protein